MKRIAMIKNNIVTNIALWDGVAPWNPGEEFTLVDVTDLTCHIGWNYENGILSQPEITE